MALLQFELDDEIAKKVVGFFNAGRPGRIVFIVAGRKIQDVELAESLSNRATSVRRFLPGATGVFVIHS